MNCVSCGTPQPEPAPRFCAACGLAVPRVTPRSEREKPKMRCGECGVDATSRRCKNCGHPVRWPEDQVPPDEDVGKPLAPDLELPAGPEGEDIDVDVDVPVDEEP